jgi:membrane protein YqaA with SNARE-associated domain
MMTGELFSYVAVTLIAFLVNVIPAFAPPTWIVLSLYKINNPQLNSLVLAFCGVIGSIAGRFVMYLYSRVLGKYIPQKQADNLNYFRRFIGEKKLGLFLGTFIYSLGPFPSNFLFIASGISGIEILPVLAGFALGRIISYASFVYISFRAFVFFEFFGIETVRYIADLLGILATVCVIFIDWRKVLEKTTNSKHKLGATE